MGFAKNQQIEHERKLLYALELAIESGVLKRCPYHEGCTYLSGKEVDNAYKLANSKWSSSTSLGNFETRREITNYIKEVVEEHGLYECNLCREIAEK